MRITCNIFPLLWNVPFSQIPVNAPVCLRRWAARFAERANAAGHWLHLYGFSPVWILMCSVRMLARENAAPHLHLKVLSVLCLCMCTWTQHSPLGSPAEAATSIILVVTKLLLWQTRLSWQNIFFVTTKICLLRQNVCGDKLMFVTTKESFVAKNICHNKMFVATKIILVAAPASDILGSQFPLTVPTITLDTFQTGATALNKEAKVVHGNPSDNHCNRSDTQLSILLPKLY